MKKLTNTQWPTMFKEDTRPQGPFTRKNALDNPWTGVSVWIGGIPTHWTATCRHYRLTVYGPKVFWKATEVYTLTFKDGRFYGNISPFIPALIEAFRLDWIKGSSWTRQLLASRKDLWKSVIAGKITNPEALAKAYSRKYFGGVFSYRNLKDYCIKGSFTPLADLYYYTTNPDLALEKLLKEEDGNFGCIMRDVLMYCKRYNERVNPLWSIKRLTEYHQNQIERRELERLEAIDPKPIAPAFKADGLELILDERTCYLEGCLQHNCVHTCYWRRIKEGRYLVAHGTIHGERITLGITIARFSDCSLRVEQVHTIYNGNPSHEVQQYCLDWVDIHHDELCAVIQSIRQFKNYDPVLLEEPAVEPVDIPF